MALITRTAKDLIYQIKKVEQEILERSGHKNAQRVGLLLDCMGIVDFRSLNTENVAELKVTISVFFMSFVRRGTF